MVLTDCRVWFRIPENNSISCWTWFTLIWIRSSFAGLISFRDVPDKASTCCPKVLRRYCPSVSNPKKREMGFSFVVTGRGGFSANSVPACERATRIFSLIWEILFRSNGTADSFIDAPGSTACFSDLRSDWWPDLSGLSAHSALRALLFAILN